MSTSSRSLDPDKTGTSLNGGAALGADYTHMAVFAVFAAAIVVRIGYFPSWLVAADISTAGPFMTSLLAMPEIYGDDLQVLMRPLGLGNLVALFQWACLAWLGIPAAVSAYVVTLAGNLVFLYGLYRLSRSVLGDRNAALPVALAAFAVGVDFWSLAIMRNWQVAPASQDIALGLVLLAMDASLRGRLRRLFLLMALLSLIHAGHAAFLLGVLGLHQLLVVWRRKLGFGALIRRWAALAVAVPLILVPVYLVHEQAAGAVSNATMMAIHYGNIGHSNPWLNEPTFVGRVAVILTGLALFLLARRSRRAVYTDGAERRVAEAGNDGLLVVSALVTSVAATLLQFAAIFWRIDWLAPAVMAYPVRSTVYIGLAAAPAIFGYLLRELYGPRRYWWARLSAALVLAWSVALDTVAFLPAILCLAYAQSRSSAAASSSGILGRRELQLWLVLTLAIAGAYLAFAGSGMRSWRAMLLPGERSGTDQWLVPLYEAILLLPLILVRWKARPRLLRRFREAVVLRGQTNLPAFAILALIFIQGVTIARTSFTGTYLDAVEVSRWMNRETPVGTKFITTSRLFTQNGIARRPTVFPLPFYLSGGYRILDRRAHQFDRQMLAFWGPPPSRPLGWLGGYAGDLEARRFKMMDESQVIRLCHTYGGQYFVTSVDSKALHYPEVFSNRSFRIYALPSAC